MNFQMFSLFFIGLSFFSCQLEKAFEYKPAIEIMESFIPMPDGIKLAADLYLPASLKKGQKLPILLEYLPYRKDEHRKLRYPVFSYFIDRGYIVARVDIRGTGRSEGKLIEYEYSEQEQLDGEVVIDWLSKQSFSSGSIGMFGISWGGFNSIHLAMRQPPALKAILAMMATDDIYEDDVHFMDGMMHVDAYEIGRDLKNVIPAAPDYIIDSSYFEEKFNTEPWLLKYKRLQRDGPFWDRASLNENYGKLKIPIFMISGWYDGYRDSTPKILQHVTAPTKAIVGPWNHTFPNMATPGPAIEWREEAVRWFDYWLKDIQNGIMEEPSLAVFIRDGHGPGVPEEDIRGEWRWMNNWPGDEIRTLSYFLNAPGKLDTIVSTQGIDSVDYHPSSGIEASGSVMWWGDWSPDIRNSDTNSLVYQSPVLKENIRILGFPRVQIKASVSAPQVHFIARLSDVSPDSMVTLVTGAGKNGSHLQSASEPSHLKPGTFNPIDIEMHYTSWTFKKGHRIRLSISNGQWPMIWPNPSPVTMHLITGDRKSAKIDLPVISSPAMKEKPVFKSPAIDPKLEAYQTTSFGTLSGFAEISDSQFDPDIGIMQVIASNSSEVAYPWAKWTTKEQIIHKVNTNDPADASIDSEYSILIDTGKKQLRWEGMLDFSSDRMNFYYSYTRNLWKRDQLIKTKTWKETIPRDYQ